MTLLIVLILCATSQPQTDSPPDSRTTWSYEIVDGRPTDTRYRRTVEDFNQDGSIWRTVHYDRSGAVERMYETLATDDQGNIVEQRIYYDYYEAPAHLRFRYEDHDYYVIKREASKPEEVAAVLKYDDEGRLTLQVWTNKFMTSVYTEFGELAEFTTHHDNGRRTRSVYSYDVQNRLDSVRRTDSRRPGWTMMRFVYDATGRRRSMNRIDERANVLEKLEFTYGPPAEP